MIATLRGTIVEKFPDSVVLEVAGVGYELLVTPEDWGATKLGEDDRLYVYEQLREDAHVLYGFRSLASKRLYEQLLSVNGVGPKLALQILGAAGESRLRQAIASGDASLLKGVAGVGPKTAQRVMLELAGKVELGAATAPVADPAYQALIGLGYSAAQASEAVAAIPDDIENDQDRIKAALKASSR